MARTTKKTAARRPRKAASRAPRKVAAAASEPTARATANSGVADLAGGLKSLLGEVEREVRSVTALSERIDGLVVELNAVREEQAQRLLALDALRASADDGGLTSFLDKLIRPRMPRVPEVVPDRLA
jgi:hypothetical protein